ncbi:dynein axonemal heavy chain 8 [Dendrobates tinctorius]|uniref:dynein axonemal heavy chain 8 n=1 Tax=Dendrobates tinctorius TaxID=92724 RepID=UPI003CC97939
MEQPDNTTVLKDPEEETAPTADVTATAQQPPPLQPSQRGSRKVRKRVSERIAESSKTARTDGREKVTSVGSSISITSVTSAHFDLDPVKHQRSISLVQRLQETLRQKQAKYKEARERRKEKINSLYEYIFEILSHRLDLECDAIAELVLDASSFQEFDEFFSVGGCRSLLFFYQEAEVPGIESGRTIPGAVKGGTMMRLLLGSVDEIFSGLCLFFIRCNNNVMITEKNMHEELHFSVLDATEGLISEVSDLLRKVFLPDMNALDKRGPLAQTRHGDREIQRFKENIEQYLACLLRVKITIEGAVTLDTIQSINFATLQSFEGVRATVSDKAMIARCEGALMVWLSQIQKVMSESEQIRKEADDSGPITELDHWIRLYVRFSFIIEQVKGDNFKAIITVLVVAKSKLIKMWKELDLRITDAVNESKDNVILLRALEQSCQPLYTLDLASMITGVPRLLNVMQAIYSVSMYYQTSEHITKLFKKVTNQIITACKACVTERARLNIWDQHARTAMVKIRECTFLIQEYQECFNRKQRDCKIHNENVFDISEICIFGKLEAFCERTDKITKILSIVQTYSTLSKSTIEGIDCFNERFTTIYQDIKRRTHNILDMKKAEFDADFTDFIQQINDLEEQLQDFMSNHIGRLRSPQQAIRVLHRFQRLKIPALDSQVPNIIHCILQNYMEMLHFTKNVMCLLLDNIKLYAKNERGIDSLIHLTMIYSEDIEMSFRLEKYGLLHYEHYKTDPPTVRSMPPVAGRIRWSRELFRKINEPITYLKNYTDILTSPEGKAAVQLHNSIGYVLVEFEVLHHRAWYEDLFNNLQVALQAKLLVRHPETKQVFINFDPKFLEIFQEIKCMIKMGLDVPEEAEVFLTIEADLNSNHLQLEKLMKTYQTLCDQILPVFSDLLSEKLRKIECTLRQGLTAFTWSSVSLEHFLEALDANLQVVSKVVTKVNYIHRLRIDVLLKDVAETLLIVLPDDGPDTVENLLASNEIYTKEMAKYVNHRSELIERAVMDIISTFQAVHVPKHTTKMKKMGKNKARRVAFTNVEHEEVVEEQTEDVEFSKHCQELCSYFIGLVVNSLQKCTRLSLDFLKRKLLLSSAPFDQCDNPFLTTEVHLVVDDILMLPSLDNIQQAINNVIHMALEVNCGVYQWEQGTVPESASDLDFTTSNYPNDVSGWQRRADDKMIKEDRTARNFYSCVSQSVTISNLVKLLSTSVHLLKDNARKALEVFEKYRNLWTENRDSKIKEYMTKKQSLDEIKERIVYYDVIEQDVSQISSALCVGFIELCTAPIKASIITEAKAWKLLLCRYLNEEYKTKMTGMAEFISENLKILSRPILDLDDVQSVLKVMTIIRENEMRIDRGVGPVEEAYAILSRFQVHVTREETEVVDALRYSFTKLVSKVVSVQDELSRIQPDLISRLSQSVVILQRDVVAFDTEYDKEGPMVPGITSQEASARLQIFQTHFNELWRRCITYSSGEQLFGLPVTEYEILHRRRTELGRLQKLYGLYEVVMKSVSGYNKTVWSAVNLQSITRELNDYRKKCNELKKDLEPWQLFLDLMKIINDFSESCPLLEMMANEAMMNWHWDRIADLLGRRLDVQSDSFCLGNIMEASILQYKEKITDICISAVKEKDIKSKLAHITDVWNKQILHFSTFKCRGELLINGAEAAETMRTIEDSLMVLGSSLNSRYNERFENQIRSWIHKLSMSFDVLEEWLLVQTLWIYLEAVFVSGDIASQLPQEVKRFQSIDKTWMKVMQRAHENANAIQCCAGDETMANLLPHLHEQLEICRKSLTGYLEGKRLIFQRFFFVSDPALLEILGQASDSHKIQPHLAAISANINEVEFSDTKYNEILSVVSREGEVIKLDRPVWAQSPVEYWLGNLLLMQQSSLNGVIRSVCQRMNDDGFQLLNSFHNLPVQVCIVSLQISWTHDAEEALCAAAEDKKVMHSTNKKFLEILNELIHQTVHSMSKYQRLKTESLITTHLHQRDVFNDLVKLHIRSAKDFEWQKQSRFYFKGYLDKVLVSITEVDFVYQNEFLACTDRLVITQLTDRCYIALAHAIAMNMGGSVVGPAGTGKTETVKDMGKALGKYVLVFNCSDQMDFRGLGRIFKGLAQSGSWGCFDEFTRIDFQVQSVAAHQISIVLTARKELRKQFIFSDGDIVNLNPECGLFLTMNPGYGDRQELPENLKIQFRTVSMMVPDRQMILRVKLASYGFLHNVSLSQKCHALYNLCEEQLSKQVHYDFGLRNILSVLRTLGSQKRARREESESSIVVRALRDMNLSKLVKEDEPLFHGLINDLFPGFQSDSNSCIDLQNSVSNQVAISGLINHPPWNHKLIQLFEASEARHGLMTLGPSGSGKSSLITVLMKALTEGGLPHRELRINPKAITAPQMFGQVNTATNDWKDGIFSALWRKTLKIKKGENVWIVLDGPVDPIWIENLNSVLDDEKTLTLANSDRIPMSPCCRLLFEVDSIVNASPGTVSRVGIVLLSSSVLPWRPVLQAWLKKLPAEERDIFQGLYDEVFQDSYTFMNLKLHPKMQLLENNYITQSINILQGCMPTTAENSVTDHGRLHRLFIFALMWSLGALLEQDCRDRFEAFLRNHKCKLDLPEADIEARQSMFDFLVDENGDWEHWNKRVPHYSCPSNSIPDYSSILVPNIEIVRTQFLIDTITKQQKAVLLTGEQATGKTVMIKAYMKQYSVEAHVSKSVNFSPATDPAIFQRAMESYVEKRIGSTYGPSGGRKMSVFIDDINLPAVNDWGDQTTSEIIRQLIEMKGMYSLEKPGEFKTMVDVQIIGAMVHPGGGRSDIPQRLKRHFMIFSYTPPSDASIDNIFGTIGCGHFNSSRNFKREICNLVKKLVPASRALWQMTKVKMLPTPSKCHYIFSLRDLSRIWQGMLAIKAEECSTAPILLALFRHECQRVIADRFVCHEDHSWFNKSLAQVLRELVDPHLVSAVQHDFYFVDFLREAPEAAEYEKGNVLEAPKVYEMVHGLEVLTEKLKQFQNLYNEAVTGSPRDLVFFNDTVMHIIRISRILRTPGGNALLIGVSGSGKKSLSRLASFIAGYKTFQIVLTRSYGVSNLLEDLKVLFKTAGADGIGITFIFTDNDIREESFLEYINHILSSGEVPSLFSQEELSEITESLLPVMKGEFPHHRPTFDHLYEYFVSRCRRNLHVILCFSPVGDKFRMRSLKFPALISGCTMDWFNQWAMQDLLEVSSHCLSGFHIACSSEVKSHVIEAMGVIHDKMSEICASYFHRFRRRTYVTPKSYLSFINGYKSIYTEKWKHITEQAELMNKGLFKLAEANESVKMFFKELVVKERELSQASVNFDKVLVELTLAAQAKAKVKSEMQLVKDKAQKIMEELESEKHTAESKLEAVRPTLEEADAALNIIKSTDISALRKLIKPSHLLMRIMDCCLLLLQKRLDSVVMDPARPCCKPSWGESLKLMSSPGFLQSLHQYPKDSVNGEMVELLQPYFRMEDYSMDNAKKLSGKAACLLSWTQSMATFHEINKEVLPLKSKLRRLGHHLEVTTCDLTRMQLQMDEKQAELEMARAKLDGARLQKMNLLREVELCRKKIENASALTEGLSGEKIRWSEQSRVLICQMNSLVGDVLIVAAFFSYCGPFNQTFRNLLLKDSWETEIRSRNIPISGNLNIVSMFIDQPTVNDWILQGLPGDDISIQNGIIMTKTTRYPLLIDPQAQGKAWIKIKEKINDLQVTSINHKSFCAHLDDCLSLGRPLLIEDIAEELDPSLDKILEQNFIKTGTIFKVKVGHKVVDVADKFRLYMTSKLPNPVFTPEIHAKTSIIDFTVTKMGLDKLLLGRVVLAEQQELETERIKLMQEVNVNTRRMKELEDSLLLRLSATTGSLVEDKALADVLRITHHIVSDLSEKLFIAADTEVKIGKAQMEYRPVASQGSILYFLASEMSTVNAMYSTSLRQFLKLFDRSIARSDRSPHLHQRKSNITEYVTYEAYRYYTRGLYEKHRFLFTLLLALRVDLQQGNIKHKELQTFLQGGAALDLKSCPPKPFKWILDTTWLNLVELSKLSQFSELMAQVTRNERGWRNWFDREAPEDEIIPNGYSSSLDSFHRLLLVRSCCPDRTLPEARKYIRNSLNAKYTEPVILDLVRTWEESDTRTPLICLLSRGTDPTSQIDELAKNLRLGCKAISMGPGQAVHARRALQMSMQQGGWILLQNCHLDLDFMNELLETIETTAAVHKTFRVWMTTEPHRQFPITLLQASIKFTNESPRGMRAGLKRTYSGIKQNLLDGCRHPMWKPLLYSLAFLHSAVQERRRYSTLGWNIPYEFSSADFSASVQFVQNHLDECGVRKGVSWSTMRYIIGKVQYGGSITDQQDKRLLSCMAKAWFSEKIFDPIFCFYTGYKIPHCKTVQQFLNHIQFLPAADSPLVFGLHPNADITYQSNTVATILNTIIRFQPQETQEEAGETREAVVCRIAEDMLEKLPPDYNSHEVKAQLEQTGTLSPINLILLQEIDRMQKVISIVRSGLSELRLAIDGTVIMSESLRAILDDMYNARVPGIWRKVSWASATLGFWFTELLKRNNQFTSWIYDERPNVFWMAGFFNPQGFLTAIRQEFAREHKGWTLDCVTMQNVVLKHMKEEIRAPPAEGVYIHGLFLEGAGWDRKTGKLTECIPKVLFTMLPVVHLFAMNSPGVTKTGSYICPVYKKPERTDLHYVTTVSLKTSEPPDHWILRGVAALCDIK